MPFGRLEKGAARRGPGPGFTPGPGPGLKARPGGRNGRLRRGGPLLFCLPVNQKDERFRQSWRQRRQDCLSLVPLMRESKAFAHKGDETYFPAPAQPARENALSNIVF